MQPLRRRPAPSTTAGLAIALAALAVFGPSAGDAASPAPKAALDARTAGQPPPDQAPAGARPPDQAPPVQGPTFRTGVDVLAVDVTVLDSRGSPVTDLGAAEFTVKIDGRPRRVVSAEYIRVAQGDDARPADDPDETHMTTNIGSPQGRLIVLVVDQGNTRLGQARPLLATAGRFLDRLGPLDRIAFAAIPPPGPAVDFTTDVNRVRRAMQQVVGSETPLEGRFNIGTAEAIAIIERHDRILLAAIIERECGMNLRADMLDQCSRDIVAEADRIVNERRQRIVQSVAALRDLFRGLAVIDGQKSVILISEGLEVEGIGADLADVAAMAAMARASLHVLLIDSPQVDVTRARASPTAREDRQLQEEGLEMLAGQARGSLFRIVGTGEGAFERLFTELAGYYLVGVEQDPADRDGRRHRIDVEVRRRGVVVRSRRAFVLAERGGTARDAERGLVEALRSPFAVSDLPLRVTTYAFRENAAGKVRVVIAAEVGQPGAPPAEFTIGFALTDADNHVVVSGSERRRLEPPDPSGDAPLLYVGAASVPPGTYHLRFGAVDSEGRRGSVVRPVRAWDMTSEALSVGDLVVGDVPAAVGERFVPAVEARVAGPYVGSYVEVYAADPATFDEVSVVTEVAADESAAAIVSAPARLVAGSDAGARVAQAVIPAGMLPPGRYLARARIARRGEPVGLLTRPFVVRPRARAAAEGAGGAGGVVLPASLVSAPPRFDLAATLEPEVVGAMLDLVQAERPLLKAALAEARVGRWGPAARAAFEAGEQEAATLLRGIELLGKGEIGAAARLFEAAAGPRRQFFPAAFYLGACLAAAGRDRDAAGIWQHAIGSTPRPAVVYPFVADARLREGQPGSAADVLRSAHERWPDDEAIGRRLGLALAMSGRYEEARPVLDAYLSRHPSDPDALLAAVAAWYEAAREGPLSDGDRAKVERYGAAYRGPQQGLVAAYVDAIRTRQGR
jgi:VWFA-related protein